MTKGVKLPLILAGVLAVVVIVAFGIIATSGSFSALSPGQPPVPAYVARLQQDGYTNIKTGVSRDNAYGCQDYAVGQDPSGDGYGELVIQCPNYNDASLAALNLSGRIAAGNLVIVQGPLSGL